MKIIITTLLFLFIIGLSLVACIGEEKSEGTVTVAELLQNPVYDTEVRIYGEVRGIGELACTCFPLASGGEIVFVWYDTMVDNDGMLQPAASVEGINKGDEIIVTGELKGESGIYYSKGDFWAKVIV
ncbi:hypothetical protein ACFLWH_01915, partial [Chloroflexota bacterium]